MQPKDIAGGIPGSSKFSYISILPTSTPTTLQPVTMATASQNVHQTLPSSAAGQILNTSNSVFPQPITIHQLEGTTVSIPVAENQGSSQLHVQQNVTNNQSAIGVAGTNGCQQVDIAHRNDSQGAAQACGPSYGKFWMGTTCVVIIYRDAKLSQNCRNSGGGGVQGAFQFQGDNF